MKHANPYHIQWLSGNGTFKIKYKVQVSFKIGTYEDTVECDVVPMTVCHMLLGRPWQYDTGAIHDGRTNHYAFKWTNKNLVLRPMTPSQIIAENAQNLPKIQQEKDPCEMSGERLNQLHVSESHKPNLSEKIKSAMMIATKCEMSDLSVTHTNNLSPNTLSLLLVLQEFKDGEPTPMHGNHQETKYKAKGISPLKDGDKCLESMTTLFEGGQRM
jgi:hypothetical protein